MPKLDDFTSAYIKALLWTASDEDGDSLDGLYTADDITTESLASIMEDCAAFQASHAQDIASNPSRAGFHFLLTRNRHGAGFWDGDYPDEVGKRLTEDAHAYSDTYAYVGYDGYVHVG